MARMVWNTSPCKAQAQAAPLTEHLPALAPTSDLFAQIAFGVYFPCSKSGVTSGMERRARKFVP